MAEAAELAYGSSLWLSKTRLATVGTPSASIISNEIIADIDELPLI